MSAGGQEGRVDFPSVLRRLRIDIATGSAELNSSNFINQQFYAEKAFQSRVANTLIREALRELSSLGYVEYVMNKGFRPIYDYGNPTSEQLDSVIEEIIEATRIRLDIETRAVSHAITHPKHRIVADAMRLLNDEEAMMKQVRNTAEQNSHDTIMGYINYNNAFHIRLGGHEYPRRIILILNLIFAVFDPYQFKNLKRRQVISHREHREILELFRVGDRDATIEKLTTHIIGGAFAAMEDIAPTRWESQNEFRKAVLAR